MIWELMCCVRMIQYSLLVVIHSLANNETKTENWESTCVLKHMLYRNQACLCSPAWPFSKLLQTWLIIHPRIAEYSAVLNVMITILAFCNWMCILSLLTGLFYYAGHGYEHAGRNYLVAVDAPQPYRPENCVCVQRIMLSMQRRCTALSVILLDTCRKW